MIRLAAWPRRATRGRPRVSTAVLQRCGTVMLLGVISLVATSLLAQETRVLGHQVDVRCMRADASSLECEYRLLNPAEVFQISATYGGNELADVEFNQRERPAGVSAIVFLVDTHPRLGEETLAVIKTALTQLLDARDAHHRFALAGLGADLEMLAPLDTSHEALLAATQQLRAGTTKGDLHRGLVHTIRVLAAYPAERRALFVVSDGQGASGAYFHEEVVRAAAEAGVVLVALAVAEPGDSPELRSLRRLAEETGGRFVQFDAKGELPVGFSENPYGIVDNGGRVTVRLPPGSPAGAEDLFLAWVSAAGTARARVPLESVPMVAPPTNTLSQAPTTVAVPAESPKDTSRAAPTTGTGWLDGMMRLLTAELLWYIVGGVALVAIASLSILLWMMRLRRTSRYATLEKTVEVGARIVAYVEVQDDEKRRYPITSTAYRIGRHGDNDLNLQDLSVSRNHAEIHRRRDGTFSVIDLDSLNGVFVNNERRKNTVLNDGDIIELGDIALKFSIQSALQQDETGPPSSGTVTPIRLVPRTG